MTSGRRGCTAEAYNNKKHWTAKQKIGRGEPRDELSDDVFSITALWRKRGKISCAAEAETRAGGVDGRCVVFDEWC